MGRKRGEQRRQRTLRLRREARVDELLAIELKARASRVADVVVQQALVVQETQRQAAVIDSRPKHLQKLIPSIVSRGPAREVPQHQVWDPLQVLDP